VVNGGLISLDQKKAFDLVEHIWEMLWKPLVLVRVL